jgi:hypothetical protein
MSNNSPKSLKAIWAIWFLFAYVLVSGFSGCGTNCQQCGFAAGVVVIIQDPNGNQRQGGADDNGWSTGPALVAAVMVGSLRLFAVRGVFWSAEGYQRRPRSQLFTQQTELHI